MSTFAARLIAGTVLVAIGLTIAVYMGAPRSSESFTFEGWIEGNFVFISADEAGRIDLMRVREGDRVAEKDLLFALDNDLQKAALEEAEAAFVNAQITFERAKDLLAKKVGSQKAFDDAESTLRSAQARANAARTHLKRRQVASPASGIVQEVYYRVGEFVQSGRPVVSLLPPGNILVRFFVPQAQLPRLHIGDDVSIRCDGCPPALTARISFISTEAEFTPPIIYSPQERSRLVFGIEARPLDPEPLRVGQPVTVVPPLDLRSDHAGR